MISLSSACKIISPSPRYDLAISTSSSIGTSLTSSSIVIRFNASSYTRKMSWRAAKSTPIWAVSLFASSASSIWYLSALVELPFAVLKRFKSRVCRVSVCNSASSSSTAFTASVRSWKGEFATDSRSRRSVIPGALDSRSYGALGSDISSTLICRSDSRCLASPDILFNRSTLSSSLRSTIAESAASLSRSSILFLRMCGSVSTFESSSIDNAKLSDASTLALRAWYLSSEAAAASISRIDSFSKVAITSSFLIKFSLQSTINFRASICSTVIVAPRASIKSLRTWAASMMADIRLIR